MAQIQVTGTSALPNVPLSQVQPAIQNDRNLLLGGVGSDLWHGPQDAANQFWLITDRGPNGQIKVDDKNRRTFPTPEFTPLILQVQAEGDQLKILKTIPIVGQSGAGLGEKAGWSEDVKQLTIFKGRMMLVISGVPADRATLEVNRQIAGNALVRWPK